MISLISFESDLIMRRKDAELLSLEYTAPRNLGIYEDQLKDLSSSYSFKEDCLEKDGEYYENQAQIDAGTPIASYWMATKYAGNIDYVAVSQSGHLVNLLIFATKCKYKFFITRSVAHDDSSVDNIELILHRLEEKTSMLEALTDKIKNNTFNKKTNVHVGGGLITTYNDLLLKEDVCTDVLQQELNNGWRIIAVCIQANQRRPDYILGRYNAALEVVDKRSAGR